MQIFWAIALIAVIVVISGVLVKYFRKADVAKSSVYERKPYLFDNTSELNLFKMLSELFGDDYYVFPQIHYNHLIQPKKSDWQQERKNRSRIDRKSADFVLCDKFSVVPRLIIELDGSIHNTRKKRSRDDFIDEITRISNLPILHIKSANLSKEFVKTEVNSKLIKPTLTNTH